MKKVIPNYYPVTIIFLLLFSVSHIMKGMEIGSPLNLHTKGVVVTQPIRSGCINYITALAAHPNDHYIVTGESRGAVSIFDLDTKQVKYTFHTNNEYYEQAKQLTKSLPHSSRGYSKKKYEEHFLLPGHRCRVNSVDCNFDGSLIASASDDATVGIWDVKTGQAIHKLNYKHCYSSVNSVAFHPTKSLIISGHGNGAIRHWDSTSGKLIYNDDGSSNCPTNCAAYSYDASVLGIARDTIINIIDTKAYFRMGITLRLIEPLDREAYFKSIDPITDYYNPKEKHPNLLKIKGCATLTWHPSRLWVALGNNNKVSIWNAETNFMVKDQEAESKIHAIAWDAQERYIASKNYDGSVSIWDLKHENNRRIQLPSKRNCEKGCFSEGAILFSRDGSYLLTTYDNKIYFMSTKHLEAEFLCQKTKERAAPD